MSSEDSQVDTTYKSSEGTIPSHAHWAIFLGIWGILLAVLNLFGEIHPTYRVSWGGLLTLEATNDAFGTYDGFGLEIGDFIFIGLCLALVGYGFKTILAHADLSSYLQGLLMNDTWPALAATSYAGAQRTIAAWSLLLGLVFYFWFGIFYNGWIDVGVYSVMIALVATGFALNYASRVPVSSDKIE